MAGVSRVNAPTVPDFTEHKMAGPVKTYLTHLVGFIQRELQRRPEQGQAIDGVMLTSPNGSVYQLTVSDAGAAVFTLMSSP